MLKQTTLIAIAMIATLTLGTHTVFAGTPEQNSAIGFQDGLRDCRSGSSDFINSHSNAGHHSADYLQGYQEGLNSCVTPQQVSSGQNGDNQNSNNREQAQSQGTSQHVFCVNVFGNCPTTSGESQGLSN